MILTSILELIIYVPKEIEEKFMKALKTRNTLIIPGMQ